MFKEGQKVTHFMSTHKVGTIIEIKRKKNDLMTAGGTTESKLYIVVKYLVIF